MQSERENKSEWMKKGEIKERKLRRKMRKWKKIVKRRGMRKWIK